VTPTEYYVLHYMDVEIHASARRHDVGDTDIRHAMAHNIVVVDLDADADPPKLLWIGPDEAGNLLEVICLELEDDRLLVIHAMGLRETFFELLPEGDLDE